MEQNILKNADLKSTKKRKLLLFLLQKQHRPMTAEALYEKAKLLMPMNVSTVYRTLNALTEKGVLIRFIRQDGKSYFALPETEHVHRLRCTGCGKASSIPFCPLGELEEDLEKNTGFQITGHTLEFTGLCPQCSLSQK